MKPLVFALALVSGLSSITWSADNILEFNWGRGTPKNSVNAGGSSESPGDRGTLWSADFLHYSRPMLAFGVGGGHFRSNDHVSNGFVPSALSTLNSKSTPVLGLMRMDLASHSPLVPYLMIGAGWVRNSFTVTAAPDSVWSDTSTSERRVIVDEAKVALGYMGALGADYNLNDKWYLGLEGRFEGSTSRTYMLTPEGSAVTGRTSFDATLPVLSVTIKGGIRY